MLLDRIRRSPAAGLRGRAVPQTLRALAVSLLLLPALGPAADAQAGTPDALVPQGASARLPQALRGAQPLGRMAASTQIKVALTLPWRNADTMDTLIHRLSDPQDVLYKKFLTHEQFVARFAPSQADYDALKAWAAANNLAVTQTFSSRNMLVVSGRSDTVETAFGVQLNRYRLATGREVYANAAAPRLPRSLTARSVSVIGLTDLPERHPLYHVRPNLRGLGAGPLVPFAAGTGPGGGLTPADIRSIYDINPLYANGLSGAGQTIALYEQNGYLATDIQAYAKAYGLPDPTIGANPTLSNVYIDGYNGAVTDPGTQGEVTLDIEMILAVAPNTKILVYEFDALNDTNPAANLALEQQIATDDIANIVSESYGGSEAITATIPNNSGGTLLDTEAAIFQQMMVQGQTMLASSGDTAAYIDQSATATPDYVVDVSDPASQPLVTAVGGTTFLATVNGAITTTDPIVGKPLVATYGPESTWFNSPNLSVPNGGGGGESTYWAKPDYQTGHGASATMRDLPDISLNADPNTGYSVYQANDSFPGLNGFSIVGGTSASCPLWAAYLALVNQQRVAYSLPVIGFANPSIYAAAEGPRYATDFHDINDKSTNGVYTTAAGFDDCTGWGTYDAANLIQEFAPSTFGPLPITVKVVGADGVTPVAGATVTVVTPQVGYLRAQNTTGTNGTVSLTLPTGVHNYNSSGVDTTLSYIVSADLSGFAGASVAGVTPSATAVVTLQILPTDHIYPAGTLQMISAPYDYTTLGDFVTLFGLTPPVGTASAGALFAYSPTLGAYLTYPTAPADTLRLGQGYWAVLPTASAYVRRKGVRAPNQSYRIGLLAGWNMIGDPFLGSVPISSITVDTVTPGTPVPLSGSATVQLPLYSYNGTAYQSLGTGDTMQPFQGYWIHATQPAELVIPAQ